MNSDRTQFGDTRIPNRNDNTQFIRELATVYNENIRLNNQHMLEYNQNMREILAIMSRLNAPILQRTPPRRPPPIIPTNLNPLSYTSTNYTSTPRSNLTPLRHTESTDVYRNNDTNEYITVRRSPTATLPPRTRAGSHNPSPAFVRALNREMPVFDVSRNVSAEQTLSTNRRRRGPESNFTSMYWRLLSEMPDLFNRDTIEADVARGLTPDEINIGLLNVDYNPIFHERIDTRCAISLEDFVAGDAIAQIVECGHIFKVEHIMRWFERQTKCPVCRCNLRHTMPSNNSENESDIERENETYNESENEAYNESENESENEALDADIQNQINNIADEFANSIVDSMLTPGNINRSMRTDQSGNMVFQYDISGSY